MIRLVQSTNQSIKVCSGSSTDPSDYVHNMYTAPASCTSLKLDLPVRQHIAKESSTLSIIQSNMLLQGTTPPKPFAAGHLGLLTKNPPFIHFFLGREKKGVVIQCNSRQYNLGGNMGNHYQIYDEA